MSYHVIECVARARTGTNLTCSTRINRNTRNGSRHRLPDELRTSRFVSIVQQPQFSNHQFSHRYRSRSEVHDQAESSGLKDVLHHALGDPHEPEAVLRQAADGIKQAMQYEPVNICEVAGFVDTLLTTPSPFVEEKLGGGPWQVVYSRGQLLWQGWSAPGKIVNMKNVASQDFCPENRSAVNKAEIFGSNIYVTASGSYCPASVRRQQQQEGAEEGQEEENQVQQTPVRVNVSISGGNLHCFGKTIGLPFIKGKASFNVMYLHDDLRVLRSGNSVNSSLVVQIRQAVLPELCAHHLK